MAQGPVRYLMMGALVAIHSGLAVVLGSVASQLWLRAASVSPWQARTASQAHALRPAGFGLVLAGLLAAAWLEAAAMADDGLVASFAQLEALVSATHYGHAWLAGVVAWILAGALLLRASSPSRLVAGLAAVGVFVLTRSVVSHAGAQGDFTLAVAVDWAHLVLACLWIGIVVVGALQQIPADDASEADRKGSLRWIGLMSDTATVIIVVIGLTGLHKVWQGLTVAGSLGTYIASEYGVKLLAKLSLVGVAAVLGGLNKFVVLPPLLRGLAVGANSAGPWRRRLVRALRIELAVLALVLVAAAALGSTETPGAG